MVLSVVRSSEDTRSDIGPRAVIEGLFLAPEKVGVGVLVEVGRELFGQAE